MLKRARGWIVTVLVASLYAVPVAAQEDDQRQGHWHNVTPSGISQSATVQLNGDGSTHISIAIQGQDVGDLGSTGSTDGRIVQAPRRSSSQSGVDASSWENPRSSSSNQIVLNAPTGGANTFGTGSFSTETLTDGTVVHFGGQSIGGWSFPTPSSPGITTGFAPVGAVPHIDAWSLALSAEHEAPPPPITLRANPDPGVVAVPSWFWIQGYDGGTINHSKTQHASHTECRLLNGVPDCRTVDDSVTVNVRLTPTNYTWDFGDGRGGSVQRYPPEKGLGRPYTDASHESPVQWSYEFDSRAFASGFPIRLTITFSGVFEANGSGWRGLPTIDNSWATGLVMRQVQTLNVVPPSLGGPQRTAQQR